MTTTVFLVRHASHDRLGRVLCGRMAGVTLGEVGLSEARRVAERLSGEKLAAVYTSPLERAVATAEPIAQAAGVELRVDEALHEIDFGDWNGATFEDLESDERWAAWNRERSRARAPGGESMAEAQARVVGWAGRMAEAHPDQTIAAVSHADVIKALIAHALGLSLDDLQRFEASPASVSVIAAGDWGMKVHAVNEVSR